MRRGVVLALALVLALVGAVYARQEPSAPPYRISALRAQLFYSDRGTFSRNIIGDSTIALWNTVIGEGTAGGPSNSTLVVVEVAGEAGSYEPGRRVELTATAGTKTPLRRVQELGVMSVRGRAYVGYWLYGTGCEEIRLSARLLGQPQASTRRATIPFECGE
ncbi:MAG TPA: hypothetical protein VF746_10855 [Longimicrobium sp.]|jgi:hypothetical protein